MRKRLRRRHWPWPTGTGALAVGLLSGVNGVLAQPPYLPIGPAPVVEGPYEAGERDPAGKWAHDHYVGRHDMFYEPPPGYYARRVFGTMKAKADPHRFTLYRTDFLPGTTRFSPVGATRFNLMASRLTGWLGPVVIEWSPDEPGLAEARRDCVVATLAGAGLPVVSERVVVGPSIYPGSIGTDSANNYNVMITRDQSAPSSWSLSPVSAANFASSVGGGGGGGGGGP
jgi:hypothetical protein